MASFMDKLKQGWNAFRNEEQVRQRAPLQDRGPSSSQPPDRRRLSYYSQKTIVAPIYNRIAVDVAAVELRHVKLDETGRYEDDVSSNLQKALNVEPNLDQGPSHLRQDAVMTLFDRGVIAIVPVDTVKDPQNGSNFDVYTLRVGNIVDWYPHHVKVDLYNENKNRREEVTLEKRMCAIVENPFYTVMNEQNSTLQRLVQKLGLLDMVDDKVAGGKLDLIIQLPYVVKSDARKQQAEARMSDIEVQLRSNKYGIAYTDGAEKITQLNRPAENQLLEQVKYLTDLLYSQLGLTPEVVNGTADEAAMLNYYHRTVEPVVRAIAEGMARSYLGERARSGKESIMYFTNPFRLVPLSQIADIADKLSRNEIVTGNEIRGFIGLRPSKEPRADSLANPNMPQGNTAAEGSGGGATVDDLNGVMDDVLGGLEKDIDNMAGANAV